MDDKPIAVLLVEDNAEDARLLQELLADATFPECRFTHVRRLDSALRCLEEAAFDLIVLDLGLPDEQGFDTFARVHERASQTPIIALTGLEDETLGLKTVRGGAQDYLVKGQFDGSLLARAMRYAIERKRTEEELRQSKERWRTHIDDANDLIFTLDTAGRFTSANRAMCQASGHREDELLGKSALELIAPESYPTAAEALAKILNQEDVDQIELTALTKDRRRITLEIRGRILYEEGRFAGTFHIARDITERKQAEDALRESENRYHQLFEAESDAVFMIDNETGCILEANGAAAAMYGYSRQELLAMKNTDLSAEPEDTRRVTRASPVIPDQVVNIPLRLHRKKDGTVFPVEITGRFFMWQGRPVHVAAIRDIAERRRTEQIRKEAYDIIRMSPAVAFLWRNTEGWPVEYVSDNVENVLGYTVEDLISGRVPYDQIVHPGDLERVSREVISFSQEAGREEFNHEPYRIVTRDGRVRWLDDRTVIRRDESGRITHYQGIVLDITERWEAESALARQEAELRATLYGIGDAVIATDVEGQVVRMNPVSEQLTGWTEAEAAGRPLDAVFGIIDEQTRRQVENPVARVLRERKTVGLTNHTLLISKDGREIPIADSAAPIFDAQGNVTGVVLLFHDQTEERLIRRFMETRLSLIEYAASHTLAEFLTRALDEVGTFVDSPIGFYHFLEADQKSLSLQQWSTRTVTEFCRAEGGGMHYSLDQAGVWVDCVHERKPVIHNDYASLPHKKGMPEGHAKLSRELVAPVMRDGRVVAILGVGNKPTNYTEKDVEIVSYLADVTWEIVRQKRAEEALRASETRYRTLFEHANDAIFLEDENDKIVDVNHRACDLMGYTREELLHMTVPDLQAPEVRGERGTVIKRELEEHHGALFESTNIHRDGRRIPVEVSTAPMPDWETGLALAIVRDISERKQAEEALRKSEQFLQDVFEAIQDGISVLDTDLSIIRTNRWMEQMYGHQMPLAGQKCYRVYQQRPSACLWCPTLRTIETGEKHAEIVPYPSVDDPIGWIELTAFPLKDEQGQVTSVIEHVKDITERKQAEEQIQASLREKEVLLKEIHHRVKNNLQVISSLLALQADSTTDPAVGQMFQDSLNRIRAMSLIHECLYQSKDLASIDAAEYVDDLVAHLFSIYANPARVVRSRVRVDDLTLGIDTAIPCGLLLTELVSNALKHAFPPDWGQEGRIDVELRAAGRERLALVVADDGVGLPADWNLEQAPSLGLQLVQVLAGQIDGTIELDRSAGTTFCVTFPHLERQP